ncbi:TPA: hypothetical protein TU158_001748 [Streptococcus equi subsp. zooepidemicus]|nr:hypothetical protein [Streptococcus equi subsp. zooepidemicus]HEL1253892.1 hypothetical protein [Streptococcus equi subsp. zooepidemicus]
MAVTYRKVETTMDNTNEKKMQKVSLKEEIKRIRSAKEKLALEDTTDTVSHNQMEEMLAHYIEEQKNIVDKLSKALDDLEKTKKTLEDESRTAEQMALHGVHKAQLEAQKITMKNLQATQDKCVAYVQALVEQAQKRTERLRKNTREDRFIPITTFLLSLLNLVLLLYIYF